MTAEAPPRPADLTWWRQTSPVGPWPDDAPGVGLHRGVVLPAVRSSVHQARVFTVATLADWRLRGLFDDVTVCVSELASNALRHARTTTVQVSLRLVSRCLWVHVRDSDPRPPVQPSALEEAEDLWECGRGLSIVEKLASGWSWAPAGDGKTVTCWFLIGEPGGVGG